MLVARVFLRYIGLDGSVGVSWLPIFEGELDEARQFAQRTGRDARVVYRRPDGIWEIIRQRQWRLTA